MEAPYETPGDAQATHQTHNGRINSTPRRASRRTPCPVGGMIIAGMLVECASNNGPGPTSKDSPNDQPAIARNVDNNRARPVCLTDRSPASSGEVMLGVLSHTQSPQPQPRRSTKRPAS